ncbi:MAG: iron-siderophore transport system permease protein, partial [Streptomyces sp.]|nr:iron-siderophore transport system permease protein [Streptomyces sp.]
MKGGSRIRAARATPPHTRTTERPGTDKDTPRTGTEEPGTAQDTPRTSTAEEPGTAQDPALPVGVKVPPGPPGTTVLRPLPGVSLLLHRRSALVVGVLFVLLGVVMLGSACAGRTYVPPGEVWQVLRGQPTAYDLVVGELRLPRIVLGAAVGVALGLAGALVQSVTRNPLASPDVIGVGHGAAAATVLALATGVATSPGALPAVAVAGGLAAAALVYALAWRHGMRPSRFVLTGVGIGVALSALVQLYLTESEPAAAEQLMLWLTGSLNGRGWAQAAPLG